MRSIYLDYNATTPLAPAAQEAMLPYLADRFADPSAEHPAGRAVGEAVEDARGRLATVLGCSSDEIVWTSGGTESTNLALRGLIEPALRAGETPHLVVSAADHAAVQGPARFLARSGAELTVVPVDGSGRVDPAAVAEAIRPGTKLVSIVYANEELGSVQPLADIGAVCRNAGVPLHTDATQALGKLPLGVTELDIDLLSLSAHKAYGPKGVGALYVRRGVGIEPQVWGDCHESGQRAGMPNVAGLVGFGAAAAVAEASRDQANARIGALRDHLAGALRDAASDARLYGPEKEEDRLAGTLCVALPGVTGSELLSAAPEVLATPLGCGGGGAGVTLSATLRSIGAEPAEAAGAVRLSLGWYTDEEEVDAAAQTLVGAWEQLR